MDRGLEHPIKFRPGSDKVSKLEGNDENQELDTVSIFSDIKQRRTIVAFPPETTNCFVGRVNRVLDPMLKRSVIFLS